MPRHRNDPPPSPHDPDLWRVHIDGSAMPNPGRMAIGAVIVAPDGTRHALSEALHATGCNNEAELRALMAALRTLRALHADSLDISTDSSILVEQLARPSPRPIARLAALFDAARAAMAAFGQVRLHWVPRHRNTEADALARAALEPATTPLAPSTPMTPTCPRPDLLHCNKSGIIQPIVCADNAVSHAGTSSTATKKQR